MGPQLSLRPIKDVIRERQSKLRKCTLTGPPSHKTEIRRKIKRLELMIKELRGICKGYNIVFKAK